MSYLFLQSGASPPVNAITHGVSIRHCLICRVNDAIHVHASYVPLPENARYKNKIMQTKYNGGTPGAAVTTREKLINFGGGVGGYQPAESIWPKPLWVESLLHTTNRKCILWRDWNPGHTSAIRTCFWCQLWDSVCHTIGTWIKLARVVSKHHSHKLFNLKYPVTSSFHPLKQNRIIHVFGTNDR